MIAVPRSSGLTQDAVFHAQRRHYASGRKRQFPVVPFPLDLLALEHLRNTHSHDLKKKKKKKKKEKKSLNTPYHTPKLFPAKIVPGQDPRISSLNCIEVFGDLGRKLLWQGVVE